MVNTKERNYNPLAEGGLTDLECAEALGIDKALCNTPEFNSACIAKVIKQNKFAYFETGIDNGMSIPEAQEFADKAAAQGEKETLDRLSDRKKRTGKDYA